MTDEEKQAKRLKLIANGCNMTLTKARGGPYKLTDNKTGKFVEEKTVRDVAIRFQRMGILGYGE